MHPHSEAHEEAIRALAHAYWEAEGRPEGRAEIHWQRAVEALADHVENQPVQHHMMDELASHDHADHQHDNHDLGMHEQASAGAAVTDVSLIDGIGPKITAMLHEAGITTLQQIAAMAESEMAALDERLELRGRSAREAWVEQAQELVAGMAPRAKADRDHLSDNAA